MGAYLLLMFKFTAMSFFREVAVNKGHQCEYIDSFNMKETSTMQHNQKLTYTNINSLSCLKAA